MGNLLIRMFVKNYDRPLEPETRTAYGKLAGSAGIAANILLFLLKILAGVLTGSLSIIADAFNNLSDAGSSIVTLVGFKLSAAPPDKEHPFGHGRMEYLSTLLVAVLIILAGFELASASLDKILHPTLPIFGWLPVAILAASIGVKLWMAVFYRDIGRRIHSEALKASMTDSRNDVICTLVVLVSTIVSAVFSIAIDGYVGMAVALFVMWSGVDVVRQTVSMLLGQAPDPEFVKEIADTVLGYDGVVGIHDMMIHNYGPSRCIVSLHAEVPANTDINKSHDVIDRIEQELMDRFHVISCIHMDPVETENEKVGELKVLTETVIGDVDPQVGMHDFRVVFGETHTNLVFDLTVPFRYENEKTLVPEIQRRLQMTDPKLFVVARIEHQYS